MSKRIDSFAVVPLPRQPEVGRAFDAPLRLAGDRLHRLDQRLARLDLDDQHEVAAPRDQVDLAELRAVAARDDAKPFSISAAAASHSLEWPRR